jgi:hypothetical protein
MQCGYGYNQQVFSGTRMECPFVREFDVWEKNFNLKKADKIIKYFKDHYMVPTHMALGEY